MNELFGISMTTIMLWLLGAFAVCLGFVLAIALANRTMFRLGLRNIPRRRAQSMLVVLGLMLATLITTAAFTVGDSLDHSITRDVYDILRPVDEVVEFKGGAVAEEAGAPYIPAAVVTGFEQRFAGDTDIDGFLPAIREQLPVINPATRLSEPRMQVLGVDQERVAKVGGLRYTDGKPVDLNTLPAGSVLINPKAADILEAKPGDTIQILINSQPQSFTVAGLVRPELLTGWSDSGPGTRNTGGITMSLAAVQQLLNKPGQINWLGVSNTGGVRDSVSRTDAVEEKIKPLLESDEGRASLGIPADVSADLELSKQEGVEAAQTFGNIFTTFFLVLGLFSIAAGMLLIFMIFVMLAAERKTEMGMARAIGMKRRGLVQSFVSEGMAYNLLAGMVGAAFGVGAAYLLVVVATRFIFGESFTMDLSVTPRSLVVSYLLGVVLTFITVFVSSWRVSKLNIVAAIRDIDDNKIRPVRGQTRWLWVVLGVITLPIVPLGLYLIIRRGFRLSSGLYWGILLVLLSLPLIVLGLNNDSAAPFYAGATLLIVSLALVGRTFNLPARPLFTVAGAVLFILWSLPSQWSEALFGTLTGDIEMFFLSGIGMVVGSTLVLVFNARLLTNLFENDGRNALLIPGVLAVLAVLVAVLGIAMQDAPGDVSQLLYMAAGIIFLIFLFALAGARMQRFAPAMKMAIAYPLANRFRTGMTIAMFSLIVFSITVMSTLTDNFSRLFVTDAARAGWDITSIINRNNPIQDFRAALAEAGFTRTDDLETIGRTTFPTGNQEVRLVGTEEWKQYPVITADTGFYQGLSTKLDARARGYADDAAVWRALQTEPGTAVVDGLVIATGFGNDPEALRLDKQIKREDYDFEPVQIEVRDPTTNKTSTLRVIGAVDNRVSFSVLLGVYTNSQTYESVYGAPRANRVFIKTAPGVDTDALNKEIKAALVTRGVESFDLRSELEEEQKLQVGFNRIFQGFMALGLFVGVAALGVIAFRSVVERRQQIGMLRAIGYQKGTVALSFIMESAFISVLGVVAGIVGASILSRNLFHSDEFADTGSLAFSIPWFTVIAFLLAGFGFALLMTWLPARRASSVPIAEALRYE